MDAYQTSTGHYWAPIGLLLDSYWTSTGPPSGPLVGSCWSLAGLRLGNRTSAPDQCHSFTRLQDHSGQSYATHGVAQGDAMLKLHEGNWSGLGMEYSDS